MKETFIWIGPSGLNPLVGQVIKGMTIIISDKQTQETLLNAGLINPANSQPLSRKKDDRRKAKKEAGAETEKTGTADNASGSDFDE